jgi:hypothetical protein
MSLLHSPTILPPPHNRIAELTRENDALKAEIRELKFKLQRADESLMAVENGASRVRTVLTPLYQALQQLFGDFEVMGVGEGAQAEADPRKSQAWENWKARLGTMPGRFIDALLVHGAMTQTQLRIAVGCNRSSVAPTVCRLNKAGLIDKESGKGGKIKLKTL